MTIELKILKIERLNNSYAGNPKFWIEAQDDNGNFYKGKTKTNGSIGYFLGWYSEGKKYDFDFHITKSGNLIFDNVKNI